MKSFFKVSVLIVTTTIFMVYSNTISRNINKQYNNCVKVLANKTVGKSIVLGG